MSRTPGPLILALLLTVIGCGSDRPPTGPSPVVNPQLLSPPPPPPPPDPAEPIPAANMVYLEPPARPPDSATDPIVGRYELQIVVSGASGLDCDEVPSSAKRRTYTADIEDLGDSYAVKLYEATFLRDASGVGYGCRDRRLQMNGICHQFLMTREGGSPLSVTIRPEDEWRGSEIWEVLSDGHVLQIGGQATGVADDERIEAEGIGGVWYGNGIPASDASACSNVELRLDFTRR